MKLYKTGEKIETNMRKVWKKDFLEFGKKHYENVAYFNFETNPSLIRTFEESIEPGYLVPLLSRIAGQTIIREKTLVIFDEL